MVATLRQVYEHERVAEWIGDDGESSYGNVEWLGNNTSCGVRDADNGFVDRLDGLSQ